ncbi:cold-shock protein [Marinimicrobium sp. ABcell2]|uniref:cold-shock protein n=1 Tax=Marinimicrobium sp. ABcell2 TaxID=3069751 RepID=UPI0027B209DC|nr:cold shock domain-containing protein [Marinimicrobium sp. ABcell2]MDQ2075586.1 cold shock domain-containing protein [Marinimicrobium sp. ABcell2]
MSERQSGTVKWFNNARGYGFITRGEGSADVFVHYRNIRGEGFRSLSEGQSVEFGILEGEKGLQAEDVVSLNEAVMTANEEPEAVAH